MRTRRSAALLSSGMRLEPGSAGRPARRGPQLQSAGMPPPAEQPPAGAPPEQTAAWWLDAVKLEERRGELLSAFDLAERGLAEHPDDLWLKHRAVLALARAGATEEAARRFEQYGLGSVREEDVAALHARIAKDLALAADGAERRRRAALAAESLRRRVRPHWRLLPGDQCRDAVAGGRRRRSRAGARGRGARAPRRRRRVLLRRGNRGRGALLRGDEGAARARARARRRTTWRRLRRTGHHAPAAAHDLSAGGISTRRCWAFSPVPRWSTSAGTGSQTTTSRGAFRAGAEATAAARIADVVARASARLRLRLAGQRRGHPLGRGAARRAAASCTSCCPFARDEFIETLGRARRAAAGSSASIAACRRRPRSATRPTMPSSATTCCTATARSSRWASRCCAARYLDAECASSRVWDGRSAAGRGRHRDRRRHLAATRGWPATIVAPLRRGGSPARAGFPEPCSESSAVGTGSSARCCSATSRASRS